MVSIQIKDVPEKTHSILKQRAALARMSLQEYLLKELVDATSRPTLEEVLDRAGGRAGGSAPLSLTSEAIREDRDSR